MPETQTLVVFALASLALIVVPGPSVIYIVTRSVSQGRRAGLVSVLGIEAGALVHVTAAALGVSALVASSATAFSVLKYAGAAYLLYLGLRKLRERPAEDAPERPDAARGDRRLFWEGALVNALNPKTATFFVAFLPQFIDPARGSVALQALVFGLLFVVIAVVSDGVWALAAGAAARRLRTRRGRSALGRVSGGVYLALGAAAGLAEGRPVRR